MLWCHARSLKLFKDIAKALQVMSITIVIENYNIYNVVIFALRLCNFSRQAALLTDIGLWDCLATSEVAISRAAGVLVTLVELLNCATDGKGARTCFELLQVEGDVDEGDYLKCGNRFAITKSEVEWLIFSLLFEVVKSIILQLQDITWLDLVCHLDRVVPK